MTTAKKNGFLLTDIPKSTNWHHSPIFGYQDISVTTLEKAVEYLASYFERSYVDRVKVHVFQALKHCKKNTKLTDDESAAIYLYTMATFFHSDLNNALRTENQEKIKPWFAYLKLLITALQKLESQKMIVYRGVASDIQLNFENNPAQTWWTVNSCSTDLKVIEFYLDGMGTVFAIETLHGKDITMYSSKLDEQEVILMPGTRLLRQGGLLEIKDRPFLVAFKECTPIPQGKHLMLSYHNSSQEIVSKIKKALQDEHIPVWPDDNSNMNHLNNSLADGVENATVVYCFITADYEKSTKCKYELEYAQKRGRKIIPCLLCDEKVCEQSDWLGQITKGLYLPDARDVFEPHDIHLTVIEIIRYIDYQSRTSQDQILERANKSCYLFELIRYEYERNSRIERLMNPAKSFSIDQSYINLSIVQSNEQNEKEKRLPATDYTNTIMGSFEEIYGSKTPIKVKDIFETCKNEEKQVLVFGRAGIGKSTFCQHIVYQWAIGSYWLQYKLLALIRLRRLTSDNYREEKSYSLIDLVIKELFPYDLSDEDKQLLKKHFDPKQTLWILDGYDEIVQNVPPHLGDLLKQLLKTPHHILTSRPYLNTLSYDVKMEITGFTDQNIKNYVQQFFDQMKDELNDALIKNQQLLKFLEANASIWGIAHIPVNLELICSLWSNQDLSETQQLTITKLYTMITEWLCRRYLTSKNEHISNISEDHIEQHCEKQLAFLEILAFNAMRDNTIVIRPSSLKDALHEAKIPLEEQTSPIKIGVLKSFHKQGIGNCVEMKKHHYFIHLSFQEYFAARYLVNLLKQSSNEKALEFIQYQKYNQRYTLMFTFMSGLLSESDAKLALDIFWGTILGEPIDLVGIRHMQLVIYCLEETSDQSNAPRRTELLKWIAECLQHNLSNESMHFCKHLSKSLERAQSVVLDEIIMNIFIELLQCNTASVRRSVLEFIYDLNLSNPPISFIDLVAPQLHDNDYVIRRYASYVLGQMGTKAATNEVIISKLASALEDKSEHVRSSVCEALGQMDEKVATNEVIISKLVSALEYKSIKVKSSALYAVQRIGKKAATNEMIISKLVSALLVSALEDESVTVRSRACYALREMGEKVATNEVIISKLVSALEDESVTVRSRACYALREMGEKVATNEVISIQLVSALVDENADVRSSACKALRKMGEKVATNEVIISKLVSALQHEDANVRSSACEALRKMGEKVATNEVIIIQLVSALEHKNVDVRSNVCYAIGQMGAKVATNEVIISKLVSALDHENVDVRSNACYAIGQMGAQVATNEVIISKLVSALDHENVKVKSNACYAIGQMGAKEATNEVIISKLVSALADENADVRSSACKALREMGEKVATNEVIISKLVSALQHEDADVRASACEALREMGEKVTTNEVIIIQLVSALDHENVDVRSNACYAIGQMGAKVATNEVIISKLVSALDHENVKVKSSACYAVGQMGAKVATNEVIIIQLVSALEHKNVDVRSNACYAIGQMGAKVATNEVISKLMHLTEGEDRSIPSKANDAIRRICSSLSVILRLDPKVILDLMLCKSKLMFSETFSVYELIDVFFTIKYAVFLSRLSILTLEKGVAVIATDGKIVVYDSKEPLELLNGDLQLHKELINAYTGQANGLYLSFPMKSESNSRTKQQRLHSDETASAQRKRKK